MFEENGCVYDAMLNQTNITSNNNKYYILQVIKLISEAKYYAFFRWGRVGYQGQQSVVSGTKQECINRFMQKFQDKTRNAWQDRNNFNPFTNKYTYISTDLSTSKSSDFQVITFELNSNHSFFKNEAVPPNITRIEPFYDKVQDYITDQSSRYTAKFINYSTLPETYKCSNLC